jgi:hypothetical protein
MFSDLFSFILLASENGSGFKHCSHHFVIEFVSALFHSYPQQLLYWELSNLSKLHRYCREPNAKPLWALSAGRPSNADIPSCGYCKGPLCYEFQVRQYSMDQITFLMQQ